LTLGYVTLPDAITGYPISKGSRGAGYLSNESPIPLYPAGWQPWHQFGDYSSMSRALYWDDGNSSEEFALEVAADSTRAVSDYLSTAQWKLFSEMGHMGAVAYMPPGTLSIYTRPNTNRTVENIGDKDKLVDIGEVPWTFAYGVVSDRKSDRENGFSPESFYFPNTDAFTKGGLTNVRRRNAMLGMPGSGNELVAMRAEDTYALEKITGEKGWPWGMDNFTQYSPHRNARSGYNSMFATCLESAVGRGFGRHQHYDLDRNHQWISTFAYFFPGRAYRIGNEWDTESLIDRTILEPVRQLYDDRYMRLAGNHHLAVTKNRMWKRFSMTTRHQPASATNDDRVQPGDEDMLQMSHRIVRYRSDYAERNRIWVTVNNPDTGKSFTIGAALVGTTFRGARQHWGWKSDQPGWTYGDMGDRYVGRP
jgi:hypothetical protein